MTTETWHLEIWHLEPDTCNFAPANWHATPDTYLTPGICVLIQLYLNRELLSGPGFTNQIAAVLLRFREKQVAVIGDIKGMINQVKIPDEQLASL